MYNSLYPGDDKVVDFADKEFPNYSVSKPEHDARKEAWTDSGSELKGSIKSLLASPDFESAINELTSDRTFAGMQRAFDLYNDGSFLCAHDFANVPFGAVSTVAKAGCLAFTSYHMLRFLGFQVNFKKLVDSITSNGYRSWHFTGDKPHRTYTKASATDFTLDELKSNYPNWDKMQSCSSLNEAFELLGEPVGIGGANAYFDNLICYINPSIRIYKDTRLNNVDDIFYNLGIGTPIPISVNNAIYYNAATKSGGHYVLLVGVNGDKFAIVDSNKRTLSFVPIKQVFEAMVVPTDPCLIFAIDAELLAYPDD